MGLYIIQYISSSLDGNSGQNFPSQRVVPVVSWDNRLQVSLTISPKNVDIIFYLSNSHMFNKIINFLKPLFHVGSRKDIINLKAENITMDIFKWCKETLNGQDLPLPTLGNFMFVTKSWSPGDKITLDLPLSLIVEAIKDDRPEYTSIKAFLYGPYLLAGLSRSDWDITLEPDTSLSDWVTPVHIEYNSHTITLKKELGNQQFVVANMNQLIKMEYSPCPGTDSAVRATFRLILENQESKTFRAATYEFLILVMLEPFDFPGMLVFHKGDGKNLEVAFKSSTKYEKRCLLFFV